MALFHNFHVLSHVSIISWKFLDFPRITRVRLHKILKFVFLFSHWFWSADEIKSYFIVFIVCSVSKAFVKAIKTFPSILCRLTVEKIFNFENEILENLIKNVCLATTRKNNALEKNICRGKIYGFIWLWGILI